MGRKDLPVLVVPSSGVDEYGGANGTTGDWAKRTLRSAYLESENCSYKGRIASSDLIEDFDVFIFDCDGVLWHGDVLIPGIQDMLNQIQQKPRHSCQENSCYKRVLFLTNNSTLSRSGFVRKLARLGINAAEEQVLCTSFATARYIVEKDRRAAEVTGKCMNGTVYVVGENGLLEELRSHGIRAIGGNEETNEEFDFTKDPVVPISLDVTRVVVGLDRAFNYRKLQTAQLYLNESNAEFIATNTDRLGNFSTKQRWAGAGCMVAAVAEAAKSTKPVCMGKPSEQMRHLLLQALEGEALNRCLLVGDNLATDIAFAQRVGVMSCVCFTGVTNAKMLNEALGSPATEENAVDSEVLAPAVPDFAIACAADFTR